MHLKRFFDVLVSGFALILLSPLLILVAIAIKRDSHGPIFFRQERVGQKGQVFRIRKFRTMISDPTSHNLQITVSLDPRITRIGCFLRRYKIDELPQLIDVLMGNMSLVGPRPEVPYYITFYPQKERDKILSVKPGITDLASIKFRNENEILARSFDPQKTYIDVILPEKIKIQANYIDKRNLMLDIKIILLTIISLKKQFKDG